ncbi:HD domain-containing protein [Verrucomicrobia bacterium]|nr:HD domain-containing protein [Verrucomicrobiota bacterium]
MYAVIEKIQRILNERGANQYGTEAVTQLEHALQSGELAEASSAPQTLVIASMLHDIGHIFHGSELPGNYEDNLDDKHEFVVNAWLKEHFGPEVADPIRLHVAVKRYLCTRQSSYEDALSLRLPQELSRSGRPNEP